MKMAQIWPRKLVCETRTATTNDAIRGEVHVGILIGPNWRYGLARNVLMASEAKSKNTQTLFG
jgi:hypothetical protein